MAIDLNGLNDQDTQQGLDSIFQNPAPVQQPVSGNSIQPNDSWNNQLSDDFSVPDVQEDYQVETQQQQQSVDNDKVRYEYWQSQADKERNERLALEKRLAELEAMQKLANQNNQAPAQPPVQQEEAFPDFTIPAPQMPIDWNDPIETARYLREKADYDGKFQQYTAYKTQWIEEKFKEKLEAQQKAFNETQQQYQERIAMEQKVQGVVSEIQQKFGATREQAMDFVQKMSDNSQFNLENMWKFYQTSFAQPQPTGYQPQGYQAPYAYNQSYSPAPSPQFNQFQRAQSIPNTMGVMRQNQQPNQSSFIDELLSYSNKRKLPF